MATYSILYKCAEDLGLPFPVVLAGEPRVEQRLAFQFAEAARMWAAEALRAASHADLGDAVMALRWNEADAAQCYRYTLLLHAIGEACPVVRAREAVLWAEHALLWAAHFEGIRIPGRVMPTEYILSAAPRAARAASRVGVTTALDDCKALVLRLANLPAESPASPPTSEPTSR